ncbi:MAG: M48 family metallopeptidase [Acidimicrobiia bacterium]
MDRAGSAIPAALGATEVGASDGRTLLRMAGQLADLGGIPTPTVFVLPCDEPNAFATGFESHDAAVTLTTGLLERLDNAELRAVMAHEVGHIVSGDVAEGTHLAHRAALKCNVTFGVTVAAQLLSFVTPSILDDWLVLGVGRFVNSAVQKKAMAKVAAHSRVRELRADEFAVRAGGGPWLASALLKIEAAVSPPEARLPEWSRIILLTDSHSKFDTHPPSAVRISAMPPFAFAALGEPACALCAAPLEAPYQACGACAEVVTEGHCSCGVALRGFDRFCHGCGTTLVSTQCRWCGSSVASGDPRCSECEAPLP